MGYYPDMSSQAAAQGYFADMIAQALTASPVVRRVPGQAALVIDAGLQNAVPAGGAAGVPPNLGGRGLAGVLLTWISSASLTNPPSYTVSGSSFTIFNYNAVAVSCFWIAIAVA